MIDFSAQEIIKYYGLLPHPEGGYYKETYRSKEIISQYALPERFAGDRHHSTAIYFLMEKGNFSAFHRIKSDECWHFYAGGSMEVYVIDEPGNLTVIKLGPGILTGETFQAVVPAGCWFASSPSIESSFSFVGCTVAPGFDFADFELATANNLVKLYPQHEQLIRRLTRN